MRLLTTFTLLTICLIASGQTSPAKRDVYVDSESMYTDSTGKGVVVIQNSFPKGGGIYTHFNGKTYSYVIFWSRVINESSNPLELMLKFPADSSAIFPARNSYIKIFLPPDTMTIEKESLYDYGVTSLKSFLDTGFYKPATLRRTINPKKESFFYYAILLYEARGTARSALVLKEQDLFYSIKIGSQAVLIPCGQIVFKK